MLSKRLQIIITLMFVAMMFVQTPAIASNTAVLNTNSSDYQSGNQFSSGNTASVNSVSSTNALNGNAQVSSVNNNYIAYNQSGTTVEMNSSIVTPGQYLNVSVNTSLINNFRYNNSLTYSIKSPIGQTPYNTSTYAMANYTNPTQPLVVNNNWQGQSSPLQGSLTYNTSSYSQLYGINITGVTPLNYTLTNTNTFTVKLTWNTAGYTDSEVQYGTTTAMSNLKVIGGFNTSHTLYLTNLQNSTKYYYQILGKDIFGRTINNTMSSFTTLPASAIGVPIISSAIQITAGTTNANLTFSTNIGISSTQVFVNLATTPGQVNNPANQVGSYLNIPVLPGTKYYFKILIENGATLNTTYDNGGQYYTFVTPQSGINLSPITTGYNSTSSQETLSFSTDVVTNASIIYSTNPNFSNSISTKMDNQSTSHVITFNVTSATNYYYMVNLTTDGINFIYIIYSNSASSTTQTSLNPLSTTYPDYYTFQTPIDPSQDVHMTHINLVFRLPSYPAVLGNWSVIFSVNQTNTIGGAVTPNTNFNAVFPVQFTLSDSLIFSPKVTYIQRGSITNGTGTYPIWKLDNNGGVYSPTDNILFVGKFSYGTAPSQYINSSLWSNYATTGLVNQYFSNNLVGANNTAISGLNNIYDSVSNTAGVKINASLVSSSNGFNPTVDNFVNVAIPAKDIYGSLTVEVGLNMPHGSSVPAYTQYQNASSLTLTVKYRLLVTQATGQHAFSLTGSNLVGSATVIPLHFTNIETAYPNSNVTNFINMPGSAIHLNLSVVLNGKQQNIFDFTNANYTWYWYRGVIDSSLSTGTYNVSLQWTGLDGSTRGPVAENNTAYSSTPKEFSYTFTLSVLYTVQDLTANLTVLPSHNVTLRFKVVVPATGVAWDKNLNITTDKGAAVFDPVTGEYHLNIVSPDTPQTVTITVKGAVTLQNDTITYTVSKTLPTKTNPNGQPVITYSQVDKHVSLIGYGFMAIAVVGTVAYAGFILYFMRRR